MQYEKSCRILFFVLPVKKKNRHFAKKDLTIPWKKHYNEGSIKTKKRKAV